MTNVITYLSEADAVNQQNNYLDYTELQVFGNMLSNDLSQPFTSASSEALPTSGQLIIDYLMSNLEITEKGIAVEDVIDFMDEDKNGEISTKELDNVFTLAIEHYYSYNPPSTRPPSSIAGDVVTIDSMAVPEESLLNRMMTSNPEETPVIASLEDGLTGYLFLGRMYDSSGQMIE